MQVAHQLLPGHVLPQISLAELYAQTGNLPQALMMLTKLEHAGVCAPEAPLHLLSHFCSLIYSSLRISQLLSCQCLQLSLCLTAALLPMSTALSVSHSCSPVNVYSSLRISQLATALLSHSSQRLSITLLSLCPCCLSGVCLSLL